MGCCCGCCCCCRARPSPCPCCCLFIFFTDVFSFFPSVYVLLLVSARADSLTVTYLVPCTAPSRTPQNSYHPFSRLEVTLHVRKVPQGAPSLYRPLPWDAMGVHLERHLRQPASQPVGRLVS